MIDVIDHGWGWEYKLRIQAEPPKATQQQKNAFYNAKLGRVQFVPKKSAQEAQADWFNILREFTEVVTHPLEGCIVVISRLAWTHPTSIPKKYQNSLRFKPTKPDNDNAEKMLYDTLCKLGIIRNDAEIVLNVTRKVTAPAPCTSISIISLGKDVEPTDSLLASIIYARLREDN